MLERNAIVISGTELNIPDGDCLVQYVNDGENTFHGMHNNPKKHTFANIFSYFEKEKHYLRRNCKYWPN